MPWIRFEDNFVEHPKVIGISDASFRLHLRVISYCARHLTDGQVTESMLHQIKPGRWGTHLANELVLSGLWEKRGKCWQIHDYLTYQPSRAEVEARRAADRSRKKADGIRSDSARNLRGIR